MRKLLTLLTGCMITLAACANNTAPEQEAPQVHETTNDGQGAKVYFTKNITAESLVKIYEALGVSPQQGQ